MTVLGILAMLGMSAPLRAAVVVTANGSSISALTMVQVLDAGFDVDAPPPVFFSATTTGDGGSLTASSNVTGGSASAFTSLNFDFIAASSGMTFVQQSSIATDLAVSVGAPSSGQADALNVFSIAFTLDTPYNYQFSGEFSASATATAFYELTYREGSSTITVFSSGSILNGSATPILSGVLPAADYRLQVELWSQNFVQGMGQSGGSASASSSLALTAVPLPASLWFVLTGVAALGWRARGRVRAR